MKRSKGRRSSRLGTRKTNSKKIKTIAFDPIKTDRAKALPCSPVAEETGLFASLSQLLLSLSDAAGSSPRGSRRHLLHPVLLHRLLMRAEQEQSPLLLLFLRGRRRPRWQQSRRRRRRRWQWPEEAAEEERGRSRLPRQQRPPPSPVPSRARPSPSSWRRSS